ncbi:TPA: hypothetical protein HA281_02315 [Candidatus Woesearchaeota archaeon]|nr:hypothetical protein [Candidatus Woesearchaeota archaeon]HII64914.1 hypothetical protein [Candidatus Woesearchaeota archaeon]
MAGRHPKPKNSLTGFEVELFTLDRNGTVVNGADDLLKQAAKDKRTALKGECAGNMLEIVGDPHRNVPNAVGSLLSNIEYAVDIAEKKNMLLCPLATYPGKFSPFMRTAARYRIQESIFGKNRFSIAGRCVGFHCHYTLPRGMFDAQLRMLKILVHSRIKDSMVNSYNTLIAIDPILTTFMQSSPYYQGTRMGKDARMLMYRGGKELDSPNGLYANFQEFGGLPPYKLTALDILDIIASRFETWKSHIRSLGVNIRAISLYGSILATTWNPVKVNPNGTLEQRGMDMNHPSIIVGIGTLMKFVMDKLQQEYYAVVPSEIGIREPFKVEKDVIYIPPYAHVRKVLQREAAYLGMESKAVHNYCRRFLKFALAAAPQSKKNMLRPLRRMVAGRKTVSDEILDFLAREGYPGASEIPHSAAAEIAIHHSRRFIREIHETRRMIEKADE